MGNMAELLDMLKGLGEKPIVIGIDGADGAGKTTIAKQIAVAINASHIELDNFLDKHKGRFIEHIRYNYLKRHLQNAKKLEKTIVIEGVCLLKVLKKLGKNLDYLIYVKRMGPYGLWYDDYYCESEVDLEKVFEGLSQIIPQPKRGEGDKENHLIFEIARYHHCYKPLEKADFVLERHSK